MSQSKNTEDTLSSQQIEEFERFEKRAVQHFGWKKISQLAHLAVELHKAGENGWAIRVLNKAARSVQWITDLRSSIFMAASRIHGHDGIKQLCATLTRSNVLKRISDYVLAARMIHKTDMPHASAHLLNYATKDVTAEPDELTDMALLHANRGEEKTARWIFQLAERKIEAAEQKAYSEDDHAKIFIQCLDLAEHVAQTLQDADWAEKLYEQALPHSTDKLAYHRLAKKICDNIVRPARVEKLCIDIIEVADDPEAIKAVARTLYDYCQDARGDQTE